MRSLIFGGTGMLGRAVAGEARRRGWPALALSRAQAEISDPAVVERWMDRFQPAALFNCAAFTQVDACEQQRERALRVNGEAVGVLAAAAARRGALLVQVSTDYVFDGGASEPYPETYTTAPLSVYGESKLLGEQRALEHGRALVLRTSWLFGPGGASFVTTILGLIERQQLPLRVVDDQVGCPTYTPFLAAALCDLAARRVTGVLHYRNREAVSWCGFAREIAALWRRGVEVVPVTTAEFPRPARRPAYSVLAVDSCEQLLERRVEHWGWGLSEYLTNLRRAPVRRA